MIVEVSSSDLGGSGELSRLCVRFMLSSLSKSDFAASRSFVSFAGLKKKFFANAGNIGSS